MKFGYCRSDKQIASWLQKALRRAWSKHPAKLALIERNRYQRRNKATGRMCFHVDCEHCKTPIPLTGNGGKIECNHKNTVGGFSVLCVEKFKEFAANLLFVGEDDLELLCKKCHEVVTYMERSGMTKEQAELEKKIIKFMELPAKRQKEIMEKHGIEPAKTIALRRNQLRKHFRAKQGI